MLAFVMVFTGMGIGSWGVDTAWAESEITGVNVYATTSDLQFQNANGDSLTVSTTSEGGYSKYTLNNIEAGLYTYTSGRYGSGKLRIQDTGDIYLRAVNFTFKEGGSRFHMTVTHPDDPELVYTSPSTGALSTDLLVPALGWGKTYRFDFCPEEEGWCAFSGSLWATKGTDTLQGFKQSSYNLSDGGAYVMGNERTVSLKVPTGSNLKVRALIMFYREPLDFKTHYEKTEDGYDCYTATVPSKVGGSLYYTVSKTGCVTTSKTIGAGETDITVYESQIQGDPYAQVDQSYEASLISNGNRAKFIELRQGEEFAIWTSRAWQAIDTGTTNRYVEPDKHYYVVDGDAVRVDDIGTVTAVKEGTAIVAMTYDAMNYEGKFYSAIDSEAAAVFVFTVGKSSDGITTGLINNTDLDTHYIASKVMVDGKEEPIEENKSVPYTFTPSDAKGETLHVSVSTVEGYPVPTKSAWREGTANEDGSFTIALYPGRNVVKVTAGDRAAYHVLNCRASNVTITNESAPGQSPKEGESVAIRFDNVITPEPKLGAIYNPGFGGTVYLEGTLNNPAGKQTTVQGDGVQYDLKETALINFTIDAVGTYKVENMRIHSGSFGLSGDAHLALSRQSDGGNYSGDDAPETAGYFSYFPTITFTAETADYEETAKAITQLIDEIKTVAYTDACKTKIEKARKAYNSASTEVKKLIPEETLQKLIAAETEYARLEEAAIAAGVKTRTVDEKEYYVITNADELKWFAKKVNGTLADAAKAETNINALLDNDITVNEAVLGDEYALMNKKAEQWTSIQDFAGIFDGQGHSINGLYQNSTIEQQGLFATNKGTVQNLTVGDSYFRNTYKTNDDRYVGSIAAVNEGKIINCTANGYLGTYAGTAEEQNKRVGGIAAENEGTISECRYAGKAEGCHAGGIVADNQGTIEKCILSGTVKATISYGGGIAAGSSGGEIRNCYIEENAKIDGAADAAGIVCAAKNTKISSCYNAGKVSSAAGMASGIYSEKNSKDISRDGKSYYLIGTASTGVIDNFVERKSKDAFESGEVAYLLGAAFGQRIGTDKWPVFADGSNMVILADGSYMNLSAESVKKMITAIGTVALGGEKDCFAKVTEAEQAYNNLSEEEKAKVNNQAVLDQKKADYTAAVDKLNQMISGLGTVTKDSGDAIKQAKSAYQFYADNGGDLEKIQDPSRIATAEEKYFKLKNSEIGTTIQKKVMDGKEYYVLTNADELYWFAGLVNGTLGDGNETKADANALLANDITVNNNLLENIILGGVTADTNKLAVQRKWTPIKTFKGSFDGQGHAISGLCTSVSNGDAAFIDTLSGGTVQNLEIKDFYAKGVTAAGIACAMTNNALIERCSTCGIIDGSARSGGLVQSAGNVTIRNSFSQSTVWIQIDQQNSTFSGGLIGAADGIVTLENCYAACGLGSIGTRGALIGFCRTKPTVKNCYFEKGSNGELAIGINQANVSTVQMKSCTFEQMANGEVAYKLGKAFGQNLAENVYPVFNNGTNTVYAVAGSYENRSLQTVKKMIQDIGTVALDGSEDCFLKTEEARSAFDELSKDMQKAIGSDYRGKLQQAEDAYAQVVADFEKDIRNLLPLTKDTGETAYQAVVEKLGQYTEREGNTDRISNYGELAAIKAELDSKMELWTQEDIEASIKTEQRDGKEFYLISNADELSWFINLVNGTLRTATARNVNANAVLTADITLNENLVQTIMPGIDIDTDQASKCKATIGMTEYGGIFDGAGYTIQGMYLAKGSFVGTLKENAQIKDLTIADAVVASGRAGLAGTMESSSVISGCAFEGAIVSKQQYTGGIAGEIKSNAKVEKSTAKTKILSDQDNVGGITGKNAGMISECAANTVVTANCKAMKKLIGGIAGENTGTIQKCYAKGKLTKTAAKKILNIGGITGKNTEKIQNCYSTVSISKGDVMASAGAIVGSSGGKIENCYYLEGVAGSFKGIGKSDVAGSAESRTAAQFKDGTVSEALGDAFTQIDDFPELKALLKKYELTVKSGTDVIGEGSYLPGTVITIKADAAPSGKTFDKWTSNDANVVFADASKAETTITMPARKVTVTATYKEKLPVPGDPGTITVSFTLLGDEVHGKPTEKTGTHTLTANNLAPWYSASITIQKSGTVKDVLDAVAKQTNIVFSNPSGNYVDGVTYKGITIEQFSNGTLSGWMYTLNGTHPLLGVKEQHLNNGDKIVFHYTDDYTKEEGSDKWNTPAAGEEVKDVTTSGAAGSAITQTPTEVKVSEKTNADGTKETVAEVKVATEHQGEILKQAAEKKSAEIILEVSAANTKGADSVQLSLEVSFVKNISDKTDADLTVNTENGKVTLDQETIKTVLAEAKGATITLEVSKVSKPTEVQKKAAGANGHLLKLTIKSGDKVISDFNKGKVKVVAEIVSKLLDKKVAAIHIADDGKIEQLAGKVLTIGGKKYYEFTTPHFSTFALVDADELGLEVKEEPAVDVKTLTAKLTPVARSAKTAKKNVKVTTSLDKQDKAIVQELKDAGYTVKYRFYRSTKKAAGYKAAVTKKTSTYTNTGGKKGTKYYYKVQVRVYDANGKLAAKTALKQCRYATRVWSK